MELVSGIADDYAKKNAFSQKARISVLFAMMRLEHADERITAMTERLIEANYFTNLNQLTQVLYILGKLKQFD